MTALVTGATGFVGSHVLDELVRRGEKVRALVRDAHASAELYRRGIEAIYGDVRDSDCLRRAVRGVAAVYHCAAAVGRQYSKKEIEATNLHGVRQLLDVVKEVQGGRVVLLSSVNVLGTRNLNNVNEDTPCCPSKDAAADVKIEMEQLAAKYHQDRQCDLVVLRPGLIYGPRDTRNLPRIAAAVRTRKFRYVGSTQNVVPIVHVSDVVQAMLVAAQRPAAGGRVYHITDGSRTTTALLVAQVHEQLGMRERQRVMAYWLAQTICVTNELLGRTGLLSRSMLRFLGTSRFVDIRRARDELGYSPQVTYKVGIADAMRWMEAQSFAKGQRAEINIQKHWHRVGGSRTTDL